MRLITKRIKVISMSVEEHAKFLECMEAAREGHTSHYAESKLDDGSFLGVSVLTKEQVEAQRREIQKREDERMERRFPSNSAQY